MHLGFIYKIARNDAAHFRTHELHTPTCAVNRIDHHHANDDTPSAVARRLHDI